MAEHVVEIEPSDDDLDEESTIFDVIGCMLHCGASSTRITMGNAIQQVLGSFTYVPFFAQPIELVYTRYNYPYFKRSMGVLFCNHRISLGPPIFLP